MLSKRIIALLTLSLIGCSDKTPQIEENQVETYVVDTLTTEEKEKLSEIKP